MLSWSKTFRILFEENSLSARVYTGATAGAAAGQKAAAAMPARHTENMIRSKRNFFISVQADPVRNRAHKDISGNAEVDAFADEFGKENVDSDNNGDSNSSVDPNNNGDSNSSVDPNNNDDSNSNNDLTAAQIRGLTQGDISKLTPEQAAAYLEKLGIKDGGVIKDVNNISVLLLLEKAGIDVKIAQNTHESVSDQWIQGKISGVQQDKDGKISYSVDCTAHGSQKNKYNFVQKEKGSSKYTVTVKEFGQGVKLADPDTASVEYEYDSGAGHLKRNGYRFTTEL